MVRHMTFLRSTNGTYYNIKTVKSIYIDNNGPTDWFVNAILDDSTVQLVTGLPTQAAADAAATRIASPAGILNP